MPNQILKVSSSSIPLQDWCTPGIESISGLSRENQRLRLEKLMLERQLKKIMDLIASNENLESLFMQQMDQRNLQRRCQHKVMIME